MNLHQHLFSTQLIEKTNSMSLSSAIKFFTKSLALSALLLTASCNNSDDDSGVGVSIAASINNVTRTTTDTSNSSEWSVSWEKSDLLCITDAFATQTSKLKVTSYGATTSTFGGSASVTEGGEYYFIHPYIGDGICTVDQEAQAFTFYLGEQTNGLSNTYLLSSESVTYDGSSFDRSSVNMSHIGAAMELSVNFSNISEGSTLSSIEVVNTPIVKTVAPDLWLDLETMSEYGNIVVDMQNLEVSSGDNIDIQFNIFAHSTTDPIYIIFNFTSGEGEAIQTKAMISETGDGATFERGRIYSYDLSCDMDGGAYIVGDIYTDPDTGAQGIVCYVSSSFALALSFDVAYAGDISLPGDARDGENYYSIPWSYYDLAEDTSGNDVTSAVAAGLADLLTRSAVGDAAYCHEYLKTNFASAVSSINSKASYGNGYCPAAEWAESLGDNWYIPTINDWQDCIKPAFGGTSYKTSSTLSDMMVAAGGESYYAFDADDEPRYWSCNLDTSSKGYLRAIVAKAASSSSTTLTTNNDIPWARAVKYIYF